MVSTLYWLFGLLFYRKTLVSGSVNIHHKPCPLQWRVVNYYLLVLQWCHTDWLKPECNYFILSVLLRKDSVSEIFFFQVNDQNGRASTNPILSQSRLWGVQRDLFSRDAATCQQYHPSYLFKSVLVHYHGNHFCCHGLFEVVYHAFGSMFVPLSCFMGSFVCLYLPWNMEVHQPLPKNRLVGHWKDLHVKQRLPHVGCWMEW